uniref:Type VI secretion system tube protein Hcp n=1 Tax=Syphacia muris TaxID=451379 RepID=A0A158R451_9BILA
MGRSAKSLEGGKLAKEQKLYDKMKEDPDGLIQVDYGQDGLIQSTLREQLWQLPVVKLRQLVTNLSGHGEHFTMIKYVVEETGLSGTNSGDGEEVSPTATYSVLATGTSIG